MKLSNLANLWLKVVGFCVAITVFTQLRDPAAVGLSDLWNAFTPIRRSSYWYFSAYVALFFLMPVLNRAIGNLTGREALLSVCGLGILVLTLRYSGINSVLLLGGGYCTLWLFLLYLVGGLMARFEIAGKLRTWQWASLYLLAVLLCYVPRMVYLWRNPELWTPENQNLSVRYTSASIILAAVALVGMFAQIRLPAFAVKLTQLLAPHSFGVYLLHTHTLIFQTAIVGQFAWLGTSSLPKLLLTLGGATAIIYAVGTAGDWVLSAGIRLLRIDRLLKKLDGLLVKKL